MKLLVLAILLVSWSACQGHTDPSCNCQTEDATTTTTAAPCDCACDDANSDHLLDWWPINDDLTDTVNGNDLMDCVNQGFAEDRFGTANGALSFTNGYCSAPQGSYMGSGPFTMMLWVNMPSDAPTSPCLMCFTDVELLLHGSLIYTNINMLFSSDVFTFDSQWHQVAMTVNSSSTVLYLDGVVVASADGFSESSQTRTPLIGAYYGFPSSAVFTGLMDDLRIYDRALSQAEVEQSMSGAMATTSGPTTTGPVPSFQTGLGNYWQLNGQMNDTIGDDSILYCTGNNQWALDRFNRPNSALALDQGYCVLPSDVYINGPFTFALWFTIPVTTNQTIIPLMYFSNNIFSDVVELAVSWDAASQPSVTFLVQSGAPILAEVISTQQLNFNVWYHVTATFDGVDAIVYIDGVEDSSAPVSGEYFGDMKNGNALGGGDFITVTMDDVRLYTRALTADEVNALYASPNVPPPAAHPLEESNMTQCSDSPVGYCSNMCDGDFPFPYHLAPMQCPYNQRCCIAAPTSDGGECTASQGFCVQRDSCPVNDLLYISGCDDTSVIPICCKTGSYYNVPVDPFQALNGNSSGQHCYTSLVMCTANGDCCSAACNGGFCG
jgi:hypothetical protein